MKLLGSSKSKITKDENGENVPMLEIAEVVLVHFSISNNDYQQDSRALYTFGQLLDILPKNFVFLRALKGYGFLSFAKNMGRHIDKNISKNLSSTYRQNLIDHTKKSATDAFKTSSKRAIQKPAEATGDLIGNKNSDIITGVSKTSPQNNSEANEEAILQKKKITYNLRLIQ